MDEYKENKEEESREYVRVEYTIPIIVESADMTIPPAEGFLKDISAQGAMFEIKEKLHTGLLVRIKLKMKKETAPICGYVKWMKDIGDRFRVGILLDDSVAEQNDKVIEMITAEIINETKSKQQE
ncbi:PilZ domain-containing protein [Elusimicrobiota bacterium]